jgi:hypothetical protein
LSNEVSQSSMNLFRTALYLSSFLALASCFQAPKYSNIPEIEFRGIRSSSFPAGQLDSVVLVFGFKDGDGDLGRRNNNDTVPNVFLTDRRFNLIDSQSFNIPNIPQRGSVPDISGEVEINLLSKMFCNPLTPGIPFDTIIFDLRVRDRAGNFSNEISTTPIILRCN